MCVSFDIVIDERETTLYDHISSILEKISYTDIRIVKQMLPLGDIVIQCNKPSSSTTFHPSQIDELCIIERKTLTDLLASIKDGRYEEQSYRLQNATSIHNHQILYLIEGVMSQVQPTQKSLIYSTITSLMFYKGFTVMRTSSCYETAEYIAAMVLKLQRNMKQGKEFFYRSIDIASGSETQPIETKDDSSSITASAITTTTSYETVTKRARKDNITPENMMHILLCQIPGVSDVMSSALVTKFHNLPNFIHAIESDPKCLDDLTYNYNGKPRKLNRTVLHSIPVYLSIEGNVGVEGVFGGGKEEDSAEK